MKFHLGEVEFHLLTIQCVSYTVSGNTLGKWDSTSLSGIPLSIKKTLPARLDRLFQLHISQHMFWKPACVGMIETTEHNGSNVLCPDLPGNAVLHTINPQGLSIQKKNHPSFEVSKESN